jgi:hypothetical protein
MLKGSVLLNTLILEAIVFSVLLGGLLLVLILMFLLRTRSLPECGWCGFQGVRRSQRQGLLDSVFRVLLLHPYRCDKCMRRFYCFRSSQVPEPSAP